MSFIPIIARADISTNGDTPTTTIKKGKITPTQMAQLNAFTLANKTGILDCLNHCTATASSVGSDNISTVTFQNGYIVICGRLIECENNTTVEINTLSIPNGKIILSIILSAKKENEVKIQVVSSSYSLKTQDLNKNYLTGQYDFELYSYTKSGSTITLTRTNTDYIPTVNTALTDVETRINKTILGTGATGSGSAPLQGYNTDKGTVEERLTALGFKKASISITNDNYIDASSEFYQLGKVLYGKWLFKVPKTDKNPSNVTATKIAKVSNIILPSENIVLGVWQDNKVDSSGYGTLYRKTTYTFTTSGYITVEETFYNELFTTWSAGTYTSIATLDLYQSPNKYFIGTSS